jgi:hypothetical protein
VKITIRSIPHDQQRYETVGDWQIIDGEVVITVSDTGEWLYNALVALHELVEFLICHDRGITQEAVDKFDIDFESRRSADNEDEPGDEPEAPYENAHSIATGVERILAAALAVKWRHFEDAINALFEKPSPELELGD